MKSVFCIHVALPWLLGVEGWILSDLKDRAEPEPVLVLEVLEEKLCLEGKG